MGRLTFNAPVRRTLVNHPIAAKLTVKKKVYQARSREFGLRVVVGAPGWAI